MNGTVAQLRISGEALVEISVRPIGQREEAAALEGGLFHAAADARSAPPKAQTLAGGLRAQDENVDSVSALGPKDAARRPPSPSALPSPSHFKRAEGDEGTLHARSDSANRLPFAQSCRPPDIVTISPTASSESSTPLSFDSTQPSPLFDERPASTDVFLTPASTPAPASEVDGEPASKELERPRAGSTFGLIPIDERLARARSLASDFQLASSGVPSDPKADDAPVQSASTSPTTVSTIPQSSLRSGTPDFELLAARKRAAEEAARFALQRVSPRPSALRRTRPSALEVVKEDADEGTDALEPLKRAINPICHALDKVGQTIAPCKTDASSTSSSSEASGASTSSSASPGSRGPLGIVKTVCQTVSVEELPSRALQRSDDATRAQNEDGVKAAGRLAMAIQAAEAGKGPTPVNGGYESIVSAVTMSQAINNVGGASAAKVLPAIRRG